MEIPVRIRELIIKLRKDGKSLRVIAEIVTKSHSTVQYIINKYQKTNSVENRKRTGRSAKLEHHHSRTILEVIGSEPKTIALNLANMIAKTIMSLRLFLKLYLTCWEKPFISMINKQKRTLLKRMRQQSFGVQ